MREITQATIVAWLQQHFYYVLIGVGLFLLVGCIRDWKWVTRIASPSKLVFLRTLAEELHGEKGKHKLERAIMTLCSLALIAAGIIYMFYF